MTDSLCCAEETDTAVESNVTQKKQNKTKQKPE